MDRELLLKKIDLATRRVSTDMLIWVYKMQKHRFHYGGRAVRCKENHKQTQQCRENGIMMKTGITKIEHQAPAVINTKDDRALWERKICWMMQKANGAILKTEFVKGFFCKKAHVHKKDTYTPKKASYCYSSRPQ